MTHVRVSAAVRAYETDVVSAAKPLRGKLVVQACEGIHRSDIA